MFPWLQSRTRCWSQHISRECLLNLLSLLTVKLTIIDKSLQGTTLEANWAYNSRLSGIIGKHTPRGVTWWHSKGWAQGKLYRAKYSQDKESEEVPLITWGGFPASGCWPMLTQKAPKLIGNRGLGREQILSMYWKFWFILNILMLCL